MLKVFSPWVSRAEAVAAEETLLSQWIGVGPRCAEMQRRLATMWQVPVENIILTNSCTSAIFLAMRCLNVKEGDDVIVPTIHFPAVANAILQLGATPVLCDVNPRSLMPEPKHVAAVMTSKTVGFCALHYGGHVCDIDAIRDVLGEHRFIFEDAATATVSTLRGRPAGTIGDAGAWSFDAMKIITMGDGGALYMRDAEAAARARRLCNLGMDSPSGHERAKLTESEWWRFEITEPSGYFASNDIAASIGLVQLDRLEEIVAVRQYIYGVYDAALSMSDVEIGIPPTPPIGNRLSYYTYWIQTRMRNQLASYLRHNDIYTTFRYYPLHRVYGISGDFPGADLAAELTLNLPLHPWLTDEDIWRLSLIHI